MFQSGFAFFCDNFKDELDLVDSGIEFFPTFAHFIISYEWK